MIESYLAFIQHWSTHALLAAIFIMIIILGKGADLLVEEAVGLASRWRVSTMLIGATLVSMGTTLPEAAVSVMAAISRTTGWFVCHYAVFPIIMNSI
jgi:cation:H+ antiporter